MKFHRFLTWLLRFCCLILAVSFAVWLLPGLTLLTTPVNTPFCPKWKIVLDANAKLRSQRRVDELRAQSRVVAQEPGRSLLQTPHGNWWVPADNDDVVLGLLEQQERDIYGLVTEGEIVLDAGAHVGVFTRRALDQGASMVIAAEPSSNAAACFRENLAAEIADGRVVLLEKGIWGFTGELTFYENGNGDAANSFVTRSPDARIVERVPVIKIDDIVDDLRLDRIDLIKMDIKGATEEALRGAAQALRRSKPRLAMATEDPPEDVVSIMTLLQPFGYTFDAGNCEVSIQEIRTSVLFAVKADAK